MMSSKATRCVVGACALFLLLSAAPAKAVTNSESPLNAPTDWTIQVTPEGDDALLTVETVVPDGESLMALDTRPVADETTDVSSIDDLALSLSLEDEKPQATLSLDLKSQMLLSVAQMTQSTITVQNTDKTVFGNGLTMGSLEDFEVSAGAKMLVVLVGGERDSKPTSVTFGTADLTEAEGVVVGASLASIWTLSDPAVGMADIDIEFGGSSNGWHVGAISLAAGRSLAVIDSDVDSGASGTSASLSLMNAPADFLAFVAEKNNNPAFTAEPSGMTDVFRGTGGGGFFTAGTYINGTTDTTFDWTFANERNAFAGVAITELPIPEPASATLAMLGAAGLLARRRRRA